MSQPREGDEQERYHVWLFKKDVDLVDALWGNNVGRSKAIRIILHKALAALQEKAAEKARTLEGSAELVNELLAGEGEGSDG